MAFTFTVRRPGSPTLPVGMLGRYGRSGGSGIGFGHRFFQNPVEEERTGNLLMSKPVGNRQPTVTTTRTTNAFPQITMRDVAGGAVKMLGPSIGAKIVQEGA